MRELRVVAGRDAVLEGLRDALSGGSALLAVPDAASPPADLPSEVESRIALVVETSGSSGRPKRVALSADAVLASARASAEALGGAGQWLLALPVHYIAGLNVLARSIAAGTDPVVVTSGTFTAAGFVAAASDMTAATRFTSLVPAQLATLLDDAGAARALGAFAAVLVGGQSTPRALLERASEQGIRVVRSYGSSETSGGCVYDGVPIGDTRVRTVDDEIWLGGACLAVGYLGDPELTAGRFVVADGSRWFRSADSGSVDSGVLAVTGRRDAVLISGGVKVAIAAVERVLQEQQGFADAVVVAAPDPRWGETPVAFTTGLGDAAAAIAAAAAACGPAARPRIVRVDAIPLLPSGKPDRAALAALAAR
jgi:O-succinylbenzoic acid--CoA ligase